MASNDSIGSLAETGGADFFGVADLSPAREAILEQGGVLIAEYPRAVSKNVTPASTARSISAFVSSKLTR